MLHLNADSANTQTVSRIWSIGAIAGFMGGIAEITWIAIYKNLAGGEAAEVARGISATLFPNFTASAATLPLGIAIHMGLAIILGIAVAVFVRAALPRGAPPILEPLAVVGLLVGVWAANFFLLLPAINPSFVALVPYTASLASKVLFGAAAASVFQYFEGPAYAVEGLQKGGQ